MASQIQVEYVKKYDLCDRNHFQILKGISILVILFALFCRSFLNIPYSQPVVHMAATVFVLCSGFGVSESFRRKGSLIHYWENKILKVWIPSAMVVVGLTAISDKDIVSWIHQSPIGLKGNWLYLIFGEYAVFWLIFQMVKKKNARLVWLFICSAAAFAVVPEEVNIKPHLFAFPVGVLLAQTGWKRKMMEAGWGLRMLVLAICLTGAAGGWILASILTVPYVQTLLWAVCYITAALGLCLLTYYLQKIPVFGIFVPFGMISYAIYLIYDRIFKMFTGQQDWRMYVALFGVIFVVAALITWLRQLLINWNLKMRRKGKTPLKGNMG